MSFGGWDLGVAALLGEDEGDTDSTASLEDLDGETKKFMVKKRDTSRAFSEESELEVVFEKTVPSLGIAGEKEEDSDLILLSDDDEEWKMVGPVVRLKKEELMDAGWSEDEDWKPVPVVPAVTWRNEDVKEGITSVSCKSEDVKPVFPAVDCKSEFVKPVCPAVDCKSEDVKPAFTCKKEDSAFLSDDEEDFKPIPVRPVKKEELPDLTDNEEEKDDFSMAHVHPVKKEESTARIDEDEDDLLELTDDEYFVLPLPRRLTAQREDLPELSDEDFVRDDVSETTEPANSDDDEDEFPPSKRQKVFYGSYDPLNARHQEFFGCVQRTVTKLAETIQTMPTQDNHPHVDLPRGLVALYPHQLYGLQWLSWREQEFPGGGILCDEMGLGKTIMMIALIMRSKDARAEDVNNWITITEGEERRHVRTAKTTLVVCPLGCLRQWESEIASKGNGLSVTVYYGPGRTASAMELSRSDIVLTTYDTIQTEVPQPNEEIVNKKKKNQSPLLTLYWRRIILDEAHNIRNPKTRKAQAICRLVARHRWAVTGTPIHNRPEDLYSIVKFLKMTPFDQRNEWDSWIGLKTIKGGDARNRLHTIGKALILRRTKIEVDNMGGCVEAIPPKDVEDIIVDLSEPEQQVYDMLMSYAQEMLQNFLTDKEEREQERRAMGYITAAERRRLKKAKLDANGVDTTVRFSHLFALLTRLRQCSVLPHLIETMLEDEEEDDSAFDKFKEEHIISKKNPIFDRFFLSAKFTRILEDLEELRTTAQSESKPMDKVVIVSCWTSTLDILDHHLKKRGFSAVFITGRDNLDERMDAQKVFNTKPMKPQVLLLSLCAGGVGLNLTGGNYVFFVEPHWNPQLELQAQDRVHRFGQKKNVYIRRYLSAGTIEERVLELQKTKIELADGLLTNTKKRAGGGLTINQMRLLFQV